MLSTNLNLLVENGLNVLLLLKTFNSLLRKISDQFLTVDIGQPMHMKAFILTISYLIVLRQNVSNKVIVNGMTGSSCRVSGTLFLCLWKFKI